MISVIIPLYNVEDYIEACLDSFELQSKNVEFEIIIINDGSTDGSLEIVERYIKQSELNIIIISQVNAGVSSARNRGIHEANGKFICFVDSDDLVQKKYLGGMLDIIENEDCDMVICATSSVEEEFVLVGNNQSSSPINLKLMNSNEALNEFLENKFTTGVWSLLIKKSILLDNNLRFSDGYKYSEDLEMVWKMIASSDLIALTSEPLYIYRIRNGSAMSYVDERRMDGLKLMQALEKYFQDKNPFFYLEFKKYGVARWVWSTVWQVAVASVNYNAFSNFLKDINTRKYMKSLLSYPQTKVKVSAFLYLVSPNVFFIIAKVQGKERLKRKINSIT